MKKALIQLHVAVFLAGFTGILGKLIELNEGLLVWYRLLFSILILGIFFYKQQQWPIIGRRDLIKVSLVGLMLALHWVFFYGSVKYANVSVAVVCFSASGFFSALIEPLILRKRIDLVELLLGTLSILGISIIFNFHPHFKTGIIFGLISALGFAAYPILNKKLLIRFPPRALLFYEFLGGFILLSILLPVYLHWYKPAYFIPSLSDLGWLCVMAIFCTVIAFDFQLNALKKISAFTSNLTYNLEPLYGILLAFVILNEHKAVEIQFYLGASLIFAAILIQMFRVLYLNKH